MLTFLPLSDHSIISRKGERLLISVQQWAVWMNKGSASIPHLLLENYKKLHLSDREMILILHIHSFLSQGVTFPSIEQLQERVTCSTIELTDMLNRLHKERFIEILSFQDDNDRLNESYTLEPLWEKLTRYLAIGVEKEIAAAQDDQLAWPKNGQDPEEVKKLEAEIFRRFELEFGRALSPMECETITLWLDEDQYEIHLIFLALREAVISNKLSLRYIDRILFEWQKNGLKTMEDVREHSKKFRQNQTNKAPKKDQNNAAVPFSFYNWLEK